MSDVCALFDGDSLAHRAYHAMPRLWTHRGAPNHAVYGFAAMLLKALGALRPACAAIAWDTPVPTFRHVAFAGYKAQRSAPPPDLYPQVDRIRDLADALGLACLAQEGYEADDLLASLAVQAAADGFEVVIVTGDTDALQLVGPGVRVLTPVKGLSEAVLYDEAAVRARCGVGPDQVADLKALAGDPSDNIPGVPGVGARTAARLLAEFGDLETLLASPDRLPPRHRDALLAHADALRRNRALTTMRFDAPVRFDPSASQLDGRDRPAVAARLRSLGLGRLADRLPDPTAPPPPARRRRRSTAPDTAQLPLFGPAAAGPTRDRNG
ncbi:MAG TPA: 5'-3' exonuclease H3TH domain-containing protein [Chloroflexota bacterium]|nr:5'-3' exonuclease H3TH domain-containing protein [Chloroflexota bacterium]